MRDLLSKLDKILFESSENTDANTQGKRKALQDIEKIPAAKDPEIKRAIDAKKAELAPKVNNSAAEGYEVSKKTGQMGRNDSDKDQRHGLYVNGKLVKTYNSRDEAENVKKRDSRFKTATIKKIAESQGVADGFQIGDEFGISFNEDFEIGSTIVGIIEDGIVIELDDRAFEFLTNEGWTFEDGEIVNEEKIKGVDGKACWKGKRYAGKVKKADGTYKDKCVAEGVRDLEYDAQSLIMKLRRDVEEKRLQPTRQAVLMAARELAGDMDFAPELLVRQVLGQGVSEAEYQGRNVPLGKPMAGDVKKSKVYVKNPQGNVVKVNFGDKKMRIKKSIPSRRKSFRARHNCSNPGPRHKARYWSCRAW